MIINKEVMRYFWQGSSKQDKRGHKEGNNPKEKNRFSGR
jgi:hypothetical protein